MPSKTLGRLLSSSASSSYSYDDDSSLKRKSRARALSDKANNGYRRVVAKSPGTLPVNLEATDSYFAGLDKRALYIIDANIDLNETDDFGFPIAGVVQTPGEIDRGSQESDNHTIGNCRVCNKEYQLSHHDDARCRQCLAFVSEHSDQRSNGQSFNISHVRAQEIVDLAIADGLRRLSGHVSTEADQSQLSRRDSRRRLLSPEKRSALHSNGLAHRRLSNRANSKNNFSPTASPRKSSRAGKSTKSETGFHDQMDLASHTKSQDAWRDAPKESYSVSSDGRACPNGPPETFTLPNLNHREAAPKTALLRSAFRPIYVLLAQSLDRNTLNCAFSTLRNQTIPSEAPRGYTGKCNDNNRSTRHATPQTPPELMSVDHKNLMVGDVYDIATSLVTDVLSPGKQPSRGRLHKAGRLVSQSSAHVDWVSLQKWYQIFMNVGISDLGRTKTSTVTDPASQSHKTGDSEKILQELGLDVRATMLRMIERMLCRPQKRPQRPEDVRYLLLLLANPLLLQPESYPTRMPRRFRSAMQLTSSSVVDDGRQRKAAQRSSQVYFPTLSVQSRVLALLIGTLSNMPAECSACLPGWLARFPEIQFRSQVDALLQLVDQNLVLRCRRTRNSSGKHQSSDHRGFAISQMFGEALESQHETISEKGPGDWQIEAACTVLKMFVRANDRYIPKSSDDMRIKDNGDGPRRKPGTTQLLRTEHFYVPQLKRDDKFDPINDFDDWEKECAGFQFCDVPFLLPLQSKIAILEHDARRKMDVKARQEFLNSLSNRVIVDKNFHLNIRRHCIVEDSLQRVADAVNSAEGEAKKALKVHFEGEAGVDAGGLRKEWFLLLVKELLNPEAGLFIYNEESNYCYFNPLSFESTEQYQLVGAVLGLAIYNFTILDIPFPPFLFRKLADAAPAVKNPDGQRAWRPSWKAELSDLAQFDPVLARNLQYILDYQGDLAEEICATFDVEICHHGIVQSTSLHSGEGEKVVDKDNRDDYVRQYIDHVLNRAVRKQFEAFARGFFSVCWGNALSLFRGEEIDLLIRGSSDFNFDVLRESAVYDNWRVTEDGPELTDHAAVEQAFPVINWFWELMQHADLDDQKRVLRWITGSDRVPAAGIKSLVLKIQCLGDDEERLPQCRTCFNILQLWNYKSRRTFVNKFWYAVVQSGQGFGLK